MPRSRLHDMHLQRGFRISDLMWRLMAARSTDAPSFGVFIGRLFCLFFIDSFLGPDVPPCFPGCLCQFSEIAVDGVEGLLVVAQVGCNDFDPDLLA